MAERACSAVFRMLLLLVWQRYLGGSDGPVLAGLASWLCPCKAVIWDYRGTGRSRICL